MLYLKTLINLKSIIKLYVYKNLTQGEVGGNSLVVEQRSSKSLVLVRFLLPSLICIFLVKNKTLCNYSLNLNNTLYQSSPLPQNILKACKSKIDEIRLKNTNAKEIILNSQTIKSTKLDIVLENKKNYSLLKTINNFFVKLLIVINTKKLNSIFYISNSLGFSNLSYNINSYYLINGDLYIFYKNSLLLVSDYNLNTVYYDLKHINSNLIYKTTLIQKLYDLTNFNFISLTLINILLTFHIKYNTILKKNKLDFRLNQTS